MRVGRSDISKFFLVSKELGKVQIDDIEDYEEDFADVIKRTSPGEYFKTEKNSKLELGKKAHEYLTTIRAVHGPQTNVRFIAEVKDERKVHEPWIEISNVGLNLYSLEFDDDLKEVKVEVSEGGILETLEARWDDEVDITAEGLEDLPYVSLKLDPRKILKRSRFVSSDIEVDCRDDSGATARAVPLSVQSPGFTSQGQFVGGISNTYANSANDTYARLTSPGNTIITNAPQDFKYVLSGTVEIQITFPAVSGYFRMHLVRYKNGTDQDFDEIILNMGSQHPFNLGQKISYTFNDYELDVKAGDSIGIMTLSNTSLGGVLKYKLTENTDLKISTDTPFKVTYTKALPLKDAFQRLSDIALEEDSATVSSDCFSSGGTYTGFGEVLLVHGSWLRNMPQIINEGEEDETRIQSLLSLEKLYGGCKILKPLRYQEVIENSKPYFYIGLEKETQQNYTSIRLEEIVSGSRQLIKTIKPKRKSIEKGFFGEINIGSTTSGSNYAQVNNLYSICGNAKWKTIHKKIKDVYEVTTEIRTGAEDIELERQFQWEDYPDLDTEMQNDWFFVHAKKVGQEYHLVNWQDLYAEKPKNVYDADSNYNWIFRPRNLLDGHGWKVKSFLTEKADDYLTFSGSNCTPSLITRKPGQPEVKENSRVYHQSLEKATAVPMEITFELPIKQEIILQLNGKVKGLDSKFGVIAYYYEGQTAYGRLIEADTNKDGKFKLIEAKI